MRTLLLSLITATLLPLTAQAAVASDGRIEELYLDAQIVSVSSSIPDSAAIIEIAGFEPSKGTIPSIYSLPYSMRESVPDWHRLWINTGIFAGAFGGTLLVLECLPEGATNWNRAAIQKDPAYKRWFNNVIKRGPEWDGDSPIFNYVLHPYAGAVYFMSARSNGFNFYQSLLYSACISTIGWEFGIEGCMERPSIQDIFVTPLVGSAVGEMFYKLKRNIVSNDYRLFGSPVMGNVVAFLIDPVNELVGYIGGNPARKVAAERRGVTSSLMPVFDGRQVGIAFSCTF